MKPPSSCTTIEEIREAIDNIDRDIISLLKQRFEYVKEVVRFKEPNKESIVAKERFDSVIASRRHLAKENGLNPDVIERMYRELLTHFIDEELKIIQQKTDG